MTEGENEDESSGDETALHGNAPSALMMGTVKVYRLKNLWDGYWVIHGTTLRGGAQGAARWGSPDEPLTSVGLPVPREATEVVQCLPVGIHVS